MSSLSPITQVDPPHFQRCVTDITGTTIILQKPAQRIVCLTATGLDILVELGLTPVGYLSEGVAAKPEFYGEQANQFMTLGSWMNPSVRAIRAAHPDLILGWQFPHRFLRHQLQSIAPLYLMGGNSTEALFQRLHDVAYLTDRMAEAEKASGRLQQTVEGYRQQIPSDQRKKILMMGGSILNCLSRKVIVETDAGPFAGVLKELTHYPWHEPRTNWEKGFTNLSLQQILAVNPDVIFVQSYVIGMWNQPLSERLANHAIWRQLKAVQANQVYEVDNFWHGGSGTLMLRSLLNHLMPIVYPEFIC
jgi:iron complex transport system substrate-binding protein